MSGPSEAEFWAIVGGKSEGRSHAQEYPDGSWSDEHGNSFTGAEFC